MNEVLGLFFLCKMHHAQARIMQSSFAALMQALDGQVNDDLPSLIVNPDMSSHVLHAAEARRQCM